MPNAPVVLQLVVAAGEPGPPTQTLRPAVTILTEKGLWGMGFIHPTEPDLVITAKHNLKRRPKWVEIHSYAPNGGGPLRFRALRASYPPEAAADSYTGQGFDFAVLLLPQRIAVAGPLKGPVAPPGNAQLEILPANAPSHTIGGWTTVDQKVVYVFAVSGKESWSGAPLVFRENGDRVVGAVHVAGANGIVVDPSALAALSSAARNYKP